MTRVSSPSRSVRTSLISSGVMWLRLQSCAPSATITIVFLLPSSRCYPYKSAPSSRKSAEEGTHATKDVAHGRLPVLVRRRTLGDEHVVRSGRDGGHEGEPPAVAAHDFDDEGARVRGGGRGDRVDCFADPVESGRSACELWLDWERGARERTNQSSYLFLPCRCRCSRRDQRC